MAGGMSKIQSFFPTLIYRADKAASARLNQRLEQACLMLAQEDDVGIRWCEKHGYPGYTSFASLDDLAARIPAVRRWRRFWIATPPLSPRPCIGTSRAASPFATRSG